MLSDPLRQGLRQLAPGPVVSQHPVAPRPLDGGRQRPRPGHLDLEAPAVPLELLLDNVEVLGEERPGSTLVDPGGVGQPPPGRLEVRAELDHHRERAPGQAGVRSATRDLGQVGEVWQLSGDHPHRLVERLRVVAGHRPDTGGDTHTRAVRRAAETIVQEPMTREPS
jgi:hypothetical protein